MDKKITKFNNEINFHITWEEKKRENKFKNSSFPVIEYYYIHYLKLITYCHMMWVNKVINNISKVYFSSKNIW